MRDVFTATGTGGRFTDAVGGPARRRVVVLLACVLGLQSADTGAIGALAAPLERAFHIGNTQLGLLVTVTTLIGAVATLPFGVVADRSNRVQLLQIVIVLWGAATVLSAVSVSYVMLLLSRLALGGVVAAAGPAVASLVGDLFPADERGRLYGFVLTGELVGAGFGIVVSGSLSGFLSWRLSLAVIAIPAFILAWAVRRWLPEPARGGQAQLEVGATEIATASDVDHGRQENQDVAEARREPSAVQQQAEEQGVEPEAELVLEGGTDLSNWEALRFVLRVRTNVMLIVASGLGYFFLQGVETFAELFFRDRFGVGQSLASILFVLVAGGAVIGVLVSGRSADRLIRHGRTNARLVVAGVAYVAAVLAFIPGAVIPVLAVSLPVLVVAAAFLGAVNPPVDAARLDVMPSSLWGRAESVRTALRQLLQGLAPLLFGIVSSAFGGGNAGIGTGVDAAATHASGGAGHALELAFVVLSLPLIVAGVFLFLSRNRYLRDVVAAGRSEGNLAGDGTN
jgi:MFS family permease